MTAHTVNRAQWERLRRTTRERLDRAAAPVHLPASGLRDQAHDRPFPTTTEEA
ncbi:hypothetical protein [Marisediminicola senii]|uniref:hypothetical protein n=1 Tax=Marisediminicola senii TaxID=2711233 RepID=UPI0013EC7238|nr:hypothetical protein [Marisediminicola senii]